MREEGGVMASVTSVTQDSPGLGQRQASLILNLVYCLVSMYIYEVCYSNYEAQKEASFEMHSVAMDRGGQHHICRHGWYA